MPFYSLPGWAEHFDKQIRPRMVMRTVTGVAANTNIAFANAKVTDKIIAAYHVTGSIILDPTTWRVTSAGNVQSTVAFTGATLILALYVS